MNWQAAQTSIDSCKDCQHERVRFLKVPAGAKRHPPWPPPQPAHLLFISVAPPAGGSYFWDESAPDRLRAGIFDALRRATGQHLASLKDFWTAGYYLVPAVKCPSADGGKDHAPAATAVENCSRHLLAELTLIRPERILALGRRPVLGVSNTLRFKAPRRVGHYQRPLAWVRMGNKAIPVAGTYFAGNKRHGGFDQVCDDIVWLLSQNPEPVTSNGQLEQTGGEPTVMGDVMGDVASERSL